MRLRWPPFGAYTRSLEGGALESVYLAAFGDGVRVTVQRDLTIEVEEYDHD